MIKHDGEWLDQNNASPTDAILCVRYFDHVTRWRSMEEPIDSSIKRTEVAYRISDDSIEPWSEITDGEATELSMGYDGITQIPYAWRPTSELPEVV